MASRPDSFQSSPAPGPQSSSALRLSLPVMFGYIPLGIAFGVLFSDLGYHWLWATAMGLFIYAGAAQFLAVGLIANHAGLFEVFVAILLLNARHLVYGLSLISTLDLKGWRRWYLIFALTDETYSLLSITRSGSQNTLQLRIAALNQGYWVFGCTLGAWLGSRLDLPTQGAEFALPALFTVLAIEQYRAVRRPLLFLAALAVAGLALMISADNMLMIAILLAVSLLLMARGREAS
ncbi:AzlC family ABC transporter permease [Marinobacterium lutimaris]|uniref:4-azaleucine resistance probable transporter AzlC n=1 Tax=Marinobacterium lutimaris TaxID=568106 RepID=A0A1H5UI63_9GAMM|nr:AzlC family ABC transporter permease [Marinobacterium lutimaris]SEF74712.1 4-azaleucine resistance probable transporter AzlC [Marinobacterium lutimaris]